MINLTFNSSNSIIGKRCWKINNGLFTTFLASALLTNDRGRMNADLNRDGELSVGELSDYLSKKVSTFSKNEQVPTWSGKDQSKIIIK